jgi:RNA polymerase sigma factor (sigma-70 family)
MSEPQSLNTHDLQFWVTELIAGRPDAAEPTFRRIMTRVEKLGRQMVRKYPRVGRFVDADDVVQNAMLRLLRALREVRPESTRHFYALANELIRRELLDLAKHYYRQSGPGDRLSAVAVGEGEGEYNPAAPEADAELDRAAAFHEAVAGLPVEQREVIGLAYYHGWPQADIAGLFGVTVRTVQRWHAEAVEMLRERVGSPH